MVLSTWNQMLFTGDTLGKLAETSLVLPLHLDTGFLFAHLCLDPESRSMFSLYTFLGTSDFSDSSSYG